MKNATIETLANALQVMVKDAKISAWLAANDPQALRQAQEALGRLDDGAWHWRITVDGDVIDEITDTVEFSVAAGRAVATCRQYPNVPVDVLRADGEHVARYWRGCRKPTTWRPE